MFGEFGVTLGCLPGALVGGFRDSLTHLGLVYSSLVQVLSIIQPGLGCCPQLWPQTFPSFGCTHSKNEDFHLKMWGQVPAQQHPWPGHWTDASSTFWGPPVAPSMGNGALGSPHVPLPHPLLQEGNSDPANDPNPANDPIPHLAAAPGPDYFYSNPSPAEGAVWHRGPSGRWHFPDKANPALTKGPELSMGRGRGN